MRVLAWQAYALMQMQRCSVHFNITVTLAIQSAGQAGQQECILWWQARKLASVTASLACSGAGQGARCCTRCSTSLHAATVSSVHVNAESVRCKAGRPEERTPVLVRAREAQVHLQGKAPCLQKQEGLVKQAR